jgi:aminoglycoside phosphotransferase (APT) family kinase protein
VNPLHGVLHEDCLELFVRRFGLNIDELEADFSGWHKRVILSPTSAFLFPRYESDVPQIDREAAALEALAEIDLVPNLVGVWKEPDIGPHPFLQTERRFGTSYASIEDGLSLDEVGRALDGLGAATARWHAIDVDDLREPLPTLPASGRWVDVLLRSSDARPHLEQAQRALCGVLPEDVAPLASSIDVWEGLLQPLLELPLVFTHGDVHETQLLVDDEMRILTVLDWDHSGLGHPARDFNFGEWGFGIFAWEDHFDELYRRYWDGYRSASDLALPDYHAIVLLRALDGAVHHAGRLDDSPTPLFNAYRLRRCAEQVRAVTQTARATSVH